jgi:hypothetical protein
MTVFTAKVIPQPTSRAALFLFICRIQIIKKGVGLELFSGDIADPRFSVEIGAQRRRRLTTTQTFQQRVKAGYQGSGIGHSPLKPFRI